MFDIREIMTSGLSEIGLAIDSKQLDLFEQFMTLMIEWNEKVNLTAITEPTEVVTKHFIDSLIPLMYSEQYKLDFSSCVDLGTGGGFPGIPLKIMKQESQILLADSLNKRISYLDLVINELGLNKISTIHSRAEEMGRTPEHREGYKTVFSRAVAAMNILTEYCLPLLQVGGIFVALKGPTLDEEMQEAENAIKILGGTVLGVEHIELPKTKDQRTLVFIKKIKATPKKYPRKPGTPKKNPL